MFAPVQKNILIAEDEKRTAHALDGRLRARGYRCTIVHTVGDAMDIFEHNRPDLVILSLTLPGGGGLEICKKVRSSPLGALVPILLLGPASGEVSSVQSAIAMGADHFFSKPDQIGDLLTKVATYIGPGLNPGDGVSPDVEASKEPPPPSTEWSALDELLRPSEHPERPALDDSVEHDTTDGHVSLLDALMEPASVPKGADTPSTAAVHPSPSEESAQKTPALSTHSHEATPLNH